MLTKVPLVPRKLHCPEKFWVTRIQMLGREGGKQEKLQKKKVGRNSKQFVSILIETFKQPSAMIKVKELVDKRGQPKTVIPYGTSEGI